MTTCDMTSNDRRRPERKIHFDRNMKTIVWKGIAAPSLEYLNMIEQDRQFVADSKIIGVFENKICFVDYHLTIATDWSVRHFEIGYEVNSIGKSIQGTQQDSEWNIDGHVEQDFSHVDFVDISLSPFTNTLPINNLKLRIGEEKEIAVIYLDVLGDEIKSVRQKYKRTSAFVYNYKNVASGFKADIEVDDSGLVKHYPRLFERLVEK